MEEKFVKNFPKGLTAGDSSVIALLGSQAVLKNFHYDPFKQPGLVRTVARVLNLLPVSMRVKIIDLISASIGAPHTEFLKMDPEAVAEWVVSGYASDRYSGVILGAPGLSATFLSGLTKLPFLPQPLLFNARRDMHPDDAQGYLEAGQEIAEPVLGKHKSIEATIHFDPVHDRFLIGRVVFIRVKYLKLPRAYREFLEKRVIPGSPVILVDCRYSWLRAKVSDRLFFQLGGLGGIAPQEFVDETEALKEFRRQWGAPSDADWKIKQAYSDGPESEWGSTGEFLDDAESVARKLNQKPVRVIHHHPGELSRRVLNLYRGCWQGSVEPRNAYIAAFTHTEPRFPIVTGFLPIWLPFMTDDNIGLADEILADWKGKDAGGKPDGTVFMTLHPSFCAPPDIVKLSTWRDLLSRYFREVHFPGIDPGRYPFDLGSYVAMYPALVRVARRHRYPGTPFRKPSLDDLEKHLTGM